MIKLKYLKILFNNKNTIKLFEIKKSFLMNRYTYNDLLSDSKIFIVSDTENVLYVESKTPIHDGDKTYNVVKLSIDSNCAELYSKKQYHLDVLFNNENARTLFNIKKSHSDNSYSYNELLKNSKIKIMNDKESVIYVIFNEPIKKDFYIRYLCKVIVNSNEFSFCGLHRYSTCIEDNLKYAEESYMVDYMKKHDRNLSLCFGSTTYM